jgi:hypothetical protein
VVAGGESCGLDCKRVEDTTLTPSTCWRVSLSLSSTTFALRMLIPSSNTGGRGKLLERSLSSSSKLRRLISMVSMPWQLTMPPVGQGRENNQNWNQKMPMKTRNRGTARAKGMPRAWQWKELINKAKIQAA